MRSTPNQLPPSLTVGTADHFRFEELLADLSARFVNVPADSVDQEILDALARLCQALDIDRAGLWQGSADEPDQIVLTHLHTVPPVPDFPPRGSRGAECYPWILRRVLGGETLTIADTANLPPEAAQDRETFRQGQVQSGLVFPLTTAGGHILGILTFGAHRHREWPEHLVTRGRLVAQVFANTLARQRAEETLRASERNYREVFNAATDAIFVHDADTGAILDVNDAMTRLYGFTRAEAVSLTVNDASLGSSPYSLAEARQWLARAVSEGPQMFRWQARRKGGELFWAEVALRSATINGQRRVLAVVRDITERKQAEVALQHSLSVLRATLESAADGILVVDLEGRIVDCNQRFLDLWRLPKELLIPGQSRDLITSDRDRATMQVVLGQLSDPDAFVAGVRELQRQPESPSFDVLHFKDGRVMERYSLPQRENGRAVGRVWSFRDVTARKHAEDELRQARDEAQLANQAKDRFLAVASHELRTPLTPIMLLASALEDDPRLPPELHPEVALIHQHVSIEKRLVDDLLDFVAIQSGKLQLRLEPARLHDAIQTALNICRPEIERKGISLRHDLQAIRDTLRADPARLRQILWNILLNAAKFTPPGGSISVQTHNPDPGSIQIAITDTGKGIDPHTLSRMFQPFEQGERTDMQHYGGLGVGLAISRILAEGHRGTITAASAGPGRGATFALRFPLAADTPDVTPRPAPQLDARAAGVPLRILLVEDHEQTRQILARILKAEQHTVMSAVSVAEALEAAGRERFDLLLSDVGLPDGSGLDLMRRLRQLYPIRGIAVSGYNSQSDRQAALDAGFCEHLSKPISLETLRQALSNASTLPTN